ncbi:hypothetical protein N782_09060 [Pontibacillus yanchengensis Y32]|uniref:Uncharacterized protein n=1 Tax=Pontibacillus yanchengensis Y32 TaxID=1385514 RepID=A0A0A2TIE9_9BACI|nr:hypothetical protein N782_09060 [Pontibacillus yanchengensis Y32]
MKWRGAFDFEMSLLNSDSLSNILTLDLTPISRPSSKMSPLIHQKKPSHISGLDSLPIIYFKD